MVGEVAARAADDPARLRRRHGRPHARLRPRLPSHDPARARPLAADRRGPAARRVVPADLGLPDRRPALRARRPPPRVGRQVARARGHRRLRDRGADADRHRRGAAAGRPAAQGPRAAVPRARAARAGAARARPPVGPVGLRPAGRGRRGVGLPRDAGAARVHGPRGGRAAVVRGGLPAGRRDAARGGFIRTSETDGDAYMRVVAARYELLRTHEWSGEVLDRLQGVERRRRGRRRAPPALGRSGGVGQASRAPGWPVAGPGREHEQEPRVARRAHLVALVRVPDRHEPGTAASRCRRRPRPRPRRRRRRSARARGPRGPAGARRPAGAARSCATRRATSAGSSADAAARRACAGPSAPWRRTYRPPEPSVRRLVRPRRAGARSTGG